MSKRSFLAIEDAFSLPKATLQLAFQANGMYSKHLEYEYDELGKLKKIGTCCNK